MRIESNDDTQFKTACKRIDLENRKELELKDKSHEPYLKNSVGEDPYLFDCPWCDALKGCLCKNEGGKEYTDGTYHRARLMLDCLEHAKKDAQEHPNPE